MASRYPAASVVMPCYNCEKYIGDAIRSVLDQTMADLELIVVDDCSTDRSFEIASKMAASDRRIHLLKNEENSGVSMTRNRGIREAKGEYIALLDSDDLWTEDKLERQIALARQKQADIVYSSYDVINEDGNPIKKPYIAPAKTDFHTMLYGNVIGCSTVMVKADLLKEHPFSCEYAPEDYALWMELLSIPVRAVGDPKILMHYRIVRNSRSADKRKAAAGQWKVYREDLKLPFFQSLSAFIGYAWNGFRKYRF